MNFLKTIAITLSILLTLVLPAFSQNLPRGEWQLAAYSFTDKVAYPVDLSQVTLNINADGRLGGRSGCNVYGGNYTSDGGLKISDIISTMMACDEASMQFERLFHATLSAANEFTFAKGVLTVIDTKTASFLRFIPVVHPNKCPADNTHLDQTFSPSVVSSSRRPAKRR